MQSASPGKPMKSPADLAFRLARQWQNADLREQRLLRADTWPLRMPIGKPSGGAIRDDLDRVRQHLQRWREVTIGRVEWQPVRFRSVSTDVDIPVAWVLASPSEWIKATGDREVQREYQVLGRLAAELDERFRTLVIRRRRLVLDKPETEVIRCGRLALELRPGCADGKPLRALSLAGVDSKFFERNRQLIVQMLDILFEGQVSETGLEAFLDAEDEGHHWLLVADLDGSLLPFSQLRVRARELDKSPLPGHRLLLVENERSLHQLPRVPETVAVLGSGLNLSWLRARWLANRAIAYWGDLDTWGLTMLARARSHQPHLTPLLMNQTVFEQFQSEKAVEEPQPAEPFAPDGLTPGETELYLKLFEAERGRLEQEFLPDALVHQVLSAWTRQ